jgi:hypothetical protein
MEKEITSTKQAFQLPNKQVMVVPVRRKGGWLPDGHAASFLHNQAYWGFGVKESPKTGSFVDPLTQAEREFFESDASGLAFKKGDLNVHKKEDNYWEDFSVKLRDEVMPLDLSLPKDYITYKVLLTNSETIAPSAAEKLKKGTYKFAIVEEGHKNEERVAAASNKKDAYRFLGKIDSSPEKMKDFLSVYYTMKPGGKQVAPNAKQDFLIAEIDKIMEADLATFLKLAKDPSYDKKVLVHNALQARAIKRVGMTFTTPEDVEIGTSLESVIAFMDNPANSDEVIRIKARIENAE